VKAVRKLSKVAERDIKEEEGGRDDIGHTLANILDKLTVVQTKLGILSDRQKTSEEIQDGLSHELRTLRRASGNTDTRDLKADAGLGVAQGESHYSVLASSDADELEGQYVAIRDFVQKIMLPANMTVGESGVTTKGEAKRAISTLKFRQATLQRG
jgi:hypothetical protein